MIITQTFTMAKWQIVVKTSEATKQTKDQNDNQKQTNTTKTTKREEGDLRERKGGTWSEPNDPPASHLTN